VRNAGGVKGLECVEMQVCCLIERKERMFGMLESA